MTDPRELFDPAWLERTRGRILRSLERNGSSSRSVLQRRIGGNGVTPDLFAAALTTLLDDGTIKRNDAGLFVLTSQAAIWTTNVPDWDRSGRRWRRVP